MARCLGIERHLVQNSWSRCQGPYERNVAELSQIGHQPAHEE
jgi:hypothetical protein